ncbi:MAG: hypothetical protein IJX30_04660 [Clostridia bacterium]|nr:hypothetical protein [Clostridia bacterium]
MRKIWLMLLSCIAFACLAFGAVGCDDTEKLAFNEGYLEEIVLGEPIMLDEYIDPELTDDYSFTLICDETGQERDLKMMGQWTTDLPGTYTIVYKVNSGAFKGKISTKISVVVPEISWKYSSPTLVYRAGDTMPFALLKRNLNLTVNSYYDYEFFLKSVSFNETTEDLVGKTEYTFPEEGTYTFTFAVKTEDGQECSDSLKVSVRPQQILAEGAEEWMADNNITSHDYTYISPDGQVSLDAGYYSSIIKDNVPYLAFNGEEGVGYGSNTYMMVDFTGKNLPQVAFFCDEVTPSYTDGKNGILITNGITNNNGTDYLGTKLNMSRLTIFGPYKVSYPEFDNRARMLAIGSVADPNPMSFHALSETDSYRYIVGIENASSNAVTIRILLINMTTCERVYDYSQKLTTSSGIGNLNLDEDYFKGSIVLYGRYGRKTEWDKVYMPITNIDSIYELDKAVSFKDSYKTQYNLDAKAYVSDYIDIPETDYEFKVFAPNGEEVAINSDGSFQYTMSGKYTLYYDAKQEGLRPNAITVRVMYDLKNEAPVDFYEIEGAITAYDDTGLNTNVNQKLVKEGAQSLECYSINGKYPSINLFVSKSFTDFIFLAREVEGITFEVYSPKAVTFKVDNRGGELLQDYTGEIPAETWTQLTITRELCMANFDIYKAQTFALALVLTPSEEGEKFLARDSVYVDNIQLLINENKATISENAKAWMDENGVEAYGYDSINDDLQATLYAGTYSKEWYNITNDDVPYIAYNGSYGAGSYVVADFTGKNVPQMAFFVKEITSSLTDGKAGIYVHTGMVKKNGQQVSPHDGGRVTFMGPNKIEYCRPDADGRFSNYGYQTNSPINSPLSINGLEDGVHYRYIAGIKSAKAGEIVIELLLINLDTSKEVVRYETKITGDWITADYISGSIVMYSRYNQAITLDKIYKVYTGVSSAYDIDLVKTVIG